MRDEKVKKVRRSHGEHMFVTVNVVVLRDDY